MTDPNTSMRESLHTPLTDSELIDRVRAGDADAYGELWKRHVHAGRTVARSQVSASDADDLVAEAYFKVYRLITEGRGPTTTFRAYLFSTIRNTAANWHKRNYEVPIEFAEAIEDPTTNEQSLASALDHAATARAFLTLPDRWQKVLWFSEVEGMTPQQIAPMIELSANATSALIYRARQALREAWIQTHLQTSNVEPGCRWTVDRLGAYSRGRLRQRDARKIEAHLTTCESCTVMAREASQASSRLTGFFPPVIAGIGGGAGITTWLGAGSTPDAASAAVAQHPAALPDATANAAKTLFRATGYSKQTVVPLTSLVIASVVGSLLLGTVSGTDQSIIDAAEASRSPGKTTIEPALPLHSEEASAQPQEELEELEELAPAHPSIAPLAVVSPAAGSSPLTNNSRYPVSGTGDPRAEVQVAVGTTIVGRTEVDGEGIWAVDTNLDGVGDGAVTLDITQMVDGVRSAVDIRSLVLDRSAGAPVITAIDTGSSGQWYPIVRGTADPGATVTVSNGTGVAATITADGAGSWVTPQLAGFGVGAGSVVAKQTDAASNASAPSAPSSFTLAAPSMSATGGVNRFTSVVSGAPNTAVQLFADTNTGWGVNALDSSGGWTKTFYWFTAPGTHTVSVRYGDGTRWGPSSSMTITVAAP